MTKNDKIRKEFIKANNPFENTVIEYLTEKFGEGTVIASNPKDNKNKHIDIFIKGKTSGKWIPFDIKQPRKTFRRGNFAQEFDNQITWFELRNTHGGPGSLFGKSLFFLQFVPGCNVAYKIPIKQLKEYLRTKVDLDFIGIASHKRPEKDYQLYTRYERQDVIFKVHIKDLVENVKGVTKLEIPETWAEKLNNIVLDMNG